MPRFFFDIHDSGVTRDDEGQELPDIEAARRLAMSSLPQIAADEIPMDSDRRHFVVLVRDGNGTPVYTATLSFAGLVLT